MSDPVFEAIMRAIGVDPRTAIRHGLDGFQTARAHELGMERFEAETVAGERVMKAMTAWLSPQLEYLHSRTVVTSKGRRPGGGILKVHRSGLPATLVNAMAGQPVGRFVEHPLLPPDIVIVETSDLRPQFDIVNLWFHPTAD